MQGRRFLLILLIFLLFSGLVNAEEIEYVDLNNWISTNPGLANWSVTDDGRNVRQTEDGGPAFFVSRDDYQNIVFKSTIKVDSAGDDFIGIVVAYREPLDKENSYLKMIPGLIF